MLLVAGAVYSSFGAPAVAIDYMLYGAVWGGMLYGVCIDYMLYWALTMCSVGHSPYAVAGTDGVLCRALTICCAGH